jgi:hypothetical protein
MSKEDANRINGLFWDRFPSDQPRFDAALRGVPGVLLVALMRGDASQYSIVDAIATEDMLSTARSILNAQSAPYQIFFRSAAESDVDRRNQLVLDVKKHCMIVSA